MDYTTWTLPAISGDETMWEERGLGLSLYEALRNVPDPRRKQGCRYEVALLLCLLLPANLAGQTTLSGATQWIRLRTSLIVTCFGLRRKKMPCQMTYTRLLARLDAQQLDGLLAAFFIRWEAQQRCENEPSRLQTPHGYRAHAQVAIDGKTIRATRQEPHPVHLLSCYDGETRTVLWHRQVETKQNEISALKPLLTPALLRGRIVTLDAMHTQRALCMQVDRC